MVLTVQQEKALERLKVEFIVEISKLTVLEMNAMRDLTRKGLARFARLRTNMGYVLVGRSLMEVA